MRTFTDISAEIVTQLEINNITDKNIFIYSNELP